MWLSASVQFQPRVNTQCHRLVGSTPDLHLHPDFRSGVLETNCHA